MADSAGGVSSLSLSHSLSVVGSDSDKAVCLWPCGLQLPLSDCGLSTVDREQALPNQCCKVSKRVLVAGRMRDDDGGSFNLNFMHCMHKFMARDTPSIADNDKGNMTGTCPLPAQLHASPSFLFSPHTEGHLNVLRCLRCCWCSTSGLARAASYLAPCRLGCPHLLPVCVCACKYVCVCLL